MMSELDCSNQHKPADTIELSLSQLIDILWQRKFLIIASIVLFSAVGIYYALSLKNVYRSDALLAPTSGSSNAMGGLASKFGGLASLAGVSLPSGGADNTTIGLEVLRSRKFVDEFVTKHQFAPELLAVSGWNKINGQLEFDPIVFDSSTRRWLETEDGSGSFEPSKAGIYEKFLESLSISKNEDTGLVTIAFEHYSPIFAQEIIGLLVNDINVTIKNRDVSKAEKSISFLKQQLVQNQLAELQAGLYDLIQSQTETIMLANASPEYLFQVIDPPTVPEKKIKPSRALICIMFFMCGAGFGVLLALLLALRTQD